MNNIFCSSNFKIFDLRFFQYFHMRKYEIIHENSFNSKSNISQTMHFRRKWCSRKSLRPSHLIQSKYIIKTSLFIHSKRVFYLILSHGSNAAEAFFPDVLFSTQEVSICMLIQLNAGICLKWPKSSTLPVQYDTMHYNLLSCHIYIALIITSVALRFKSIGNYVIHYEAVV